MKSRILRATAIAPLLMGMLVTGCRDGLAPELRGASVEIFLASTAYDEQTIAVGSTIDLSAQVLDAAGNEIDGELISWSSDDPEVATVDEGGAVHGVAEGSTNIIAKHGVGEDTARINVAAPLTGDPSCVAGDALAFEIGETRAFAGSESADLCLPGEADYSLVLVNTGTTAAARLEADIEATGVASSFGPPTPNLVALRTSGRPSPDALFHRRLRQEVSGQLEPRLRTGIDSGAFGAMAMQVSEGQVLSFNVESSSSDGCRKESIDLRGARVRLITDHAIIVEDTLNPAGGFTDTDYEEFGNFFDDEAWPLVTTTFGEPSDIDENGKVFILFTRAVNERVENSSSQRGSFVGGFFFNRDLFPVEGTSGCAGSNEAEMFYMLVPDPAGEVQGRGFRLEDVRNNTRTVLVHEFQHLVNDSRRLHINKSSLWEETWLNEGLSHIAEELMFYDQSGLDPRMNLGPDEFRNNAAARAALGAFQLANLDRVAAMLRDPDGTSLMGDDALETRGAAWYFLRYAADRRGGDEGALWKSLVHDTRSAGLDNLQLALGADPREWIADWATAVYLDDALETIPAKYETLSWNLRDLYPALGDFWPSAYYQQYPLAVRSLPLAQPAGPVSLQGGAALYLRTGVRAGKVGAIRVTVGDNLPAPSRLRVMVTRVS